MGIIRLLVNRLEQLGARTRKIHENTMQQVENQYFGHRQTKGGDQEYRWPFIKDVRLDKALQKYFMSDKDEQSNNQNRSNLMFVMGTEGIGKSWLLRHNLTIFQNNLKQDPFLSTQVMHLDCARLFQGESIRYDHFLFHFKELLIQGILGIHGKTRSMDKQSFMTEAMMVQVFFNRERQQESKSVYMNLKDVLSLLINDVEPSLQIKKDDKPILEEALQDLQQIYYEDQMDQSLIDIINRVACLLANYYSGRPEALIRLFLMIAQHNEYQSRPKEYTHSYYQNGLQQIDVLFDIINYSGGFSELGHYSYEQNRQESNRKWIHPVLVVENSDRVFMQNTSRILNENQEQFQRLEEHLLLRLYQPLDHRTHFPIIIESSRSKYFNRDIFDNLGLPDHSAYVSLELYGHTREVMATHLQGKNKVFSISNYDSIVDSIGLNLRDLFNYARNVTQQPSLLGLTLEQQPYFYKEKRIFYYKLGRVYQHLMNYQALDDGTLDWALLNFMEVITSKEYSGALWMGNNVAEAVLVENGLYQALVDSGILYHRKYFPYATLQKQTYLLFAKEYVNDKMKAMNRKQRVAYWLYKKSNRDILRKHRELEPAQAMKDKNLHGKKSYFIYELGEVYFEHPTVDDLKGNIYHMV